MTNQTTCRHGDTKQSRYRTRGLLDFSTFEETREIGGTTV